MALIVFDLLATLLNSGPRYIEAYIRTCHEYGLDIIPARSDLQDMLGEKNLKEIIAACSPEVSPEHQGRFMQSCNSMCDRLLVDDSWDEKLFPETVETLKKLKSMGHELGIFTGTREDSMMAQLYHHKLIQFFRPQYIAGKNNDRDGMLDTLSLKSMQLKRIKSDYAGYIYIVGDSHTDLAASRKLEMPFIAIARTDKAREQFETLRAPVIIGSLPQISDLPFINSGQKFALPEARLAP